ncbi:MAG: MerR family transcriptional regulator [Acidimicrobiales bacterium]
MRGRTGYYGQIHIERLEVIRRLQAQGVNLSTIAKIVGPEASPAAALFMSDLVGHELATAADG